jgi:hypothetical protein
MRVVKKRNLSLKSILFNFYSYKEAFSSYDAYYSARMLLTVFYDVKQKHNTEYYDFVLDIVLEHFNRHDLRQFKEYLESVESVYKTLIWRLEDVSITE